MNQSRSLANPSIIVSAGRNSGRSGESATADRAPAPDFNTPNVDVYNLCVVLWEMLPGETCGPFVCWIFRNHIVPRLGGSLVIFHLTAATSAVEGYRPRFFGPIIPPSHLSVRRCMARHSRSGCSRGAF